MDRTPAKDLEAWLAHPRRRPLVLRGARQVGKTWLVRELASRARRDLVELNFEREPRLARTFASTNPREILDDLALLAGRDIPIDRSLLFLDEIQAAGDVLARL